MSLSQIYEIQTPQGAISAFFSTRRENGGKKIVKN